MKSLVEFIRESEETVYTIIDKDGTVVNVANTEDEAKKIADDYNKQNPDNQAEVKADKKSSVVKED